MLDAAPEPTKTTITTLFCDSTVHTLGTSRRKLGIKFYTFRLHQAVIGAARNPNQHIALITMIERDNLTQEVVRTCNSGFFNCSHLNT